MRIALLLAGLALATASSASAVVIDFEDGDRSGGGVFHSGGTSIQADPSGLSGNVLLVQSFTGLFFDRFDAPDYMQYLITSFDIRALSDTTLMLGTVDTFENGAYGVTGAALNQPLTAGEWTTVTTEYGSNFVISSGYSVVGDIRAAGGFYIDNITYGIVDQHYRGDFRYPVPVPEPATWAMMIAGFGLIGGTMRRRAGKPEAAAA